MVGSRWDGGGVGDAVQREGERPTAQAVQVALRYFESVQVTDFDTLLRELRRPAPPASVRAWVIENLPAEGALTPTAEEAAKLHVLLPVLAFHGREQDMELRLITAGGLAFVGLHARTVLLISREALRLLDAKELLAIGAHELGHDYVWDDYEEARQAGNTRRLRSWAAVRQVRRHHDGGPACGSEQLVAGVIAHKIQHAQIRKRCSRYVPLTSIWFIRSIATLTAARVGRCIQPLFGGRRSSSAVRTTCRFRPSPAPAIGSGQ